MPLIPFGEYRPDVTDYDQAATGAVLNALPRGDGYGPMPALSAYGGLPASIRVEQAQPDRPRPREARSGRLAQAQSRRLITGPKCC